VGRSAHKTGARRRNDDSLTQAPRYEGSKIPLLCECESADCRRLLWVPERIWQAIRAEPDEFIAAPEHVSDDTMVLRREPGFIVFRSG
jgi:hypothetical protein